MAESTRRARDNEEETSRRRRKNPHEGEFYKVSAGLTSTRGVHDEGELVSHEDMGPGFKALHPDEQEDRFGRVMYRAYEPSDEERRRLKLGGVARAEFSPEDEEDEDNDEEENEEVVEVKELKDLNDEELWQMSQAEGLSFPRETPRNILEGALTKHMRETEEQQKKAADAAKTTEPRRKK